MLIALITDTHAGVRNDNISILDHQKAFYDEVFFPFIKSNKIRTVVHLGDIVDRRKYVNFNTLNRLRKDFLEPLNQEVPNVHIIAGNHDVYFKNTNDLNSLSELLENKYPDFKLHHSPTSIFFEDETTALLLPWICQENYDATMAAIAYSQSSILMGHLELNGFEMYRGSFCNKPDALYQETFGKFHTVLTGHFHHKSDFENIHYLGCPFQMDWGDYGDQKGFHTFDTKTHELTFIPNPYSLFYKIEYDDKDKTMEQVLNQDFSKYHKSFVRLLIKNKENSFWFDSFQTKLETVEPLSIQIIEDMGHLAFDGDETELLHVEDTMTLLAKYCEQIGIKEDMKPKLKALLGNLYQEANNTRLT